MKKMRIPRDVLLDLLPVYLAGEASEETKIWIEQQLTDEPELRRIVERMKRERLPRAPGFAVPDHEMKAFARTKNLMFQRSLFLTLAVAFTLFFAVSMGFLLDTHPQAGAISFVLSAIFWAVYWINGWRMSRP